jgi:hypothetical protein
MFSLFIKNCTYQLLGKPKSINSYSLISISSQVVFMAIGLTLVNIVFKVK